VSLTLLSRNNFLDFVEEIASLKSSIAHRLG